MWCRCANWRCIRYVATNDRKAIHARGHVAASALLAVSVMAEGAQQASSRGAGQTYPTRPVRLIVSNTPGSPSDVIGRLVSANLSEARGHQVVIELGPEAVGSSPAECGTFLQKETERWDKVLLDGATLPAARG